LGRVRRYLLKKIGLKLLKKGTVEGTKYDGVAGEIGEVVDRIPSRDMGIGGFALIRQRVGVGDEARLSIVSARKPRNLGLVIKLPLGTDGFSHLQGFTVVKSDAIKE